MSGPARLIKGSMVKEEITAGLIGCRYLTCCLEAMSGLVAISKLFLLTALPTLVFCSGGFGGGGGGASTSGRSQQSKANEAVHPNDVVRQDMVRGPACLQLTTCTVVKMVCCALVHLMSIFMRAKNLALYLSRGGMFKSAARHKLIHGLDA
eukprot:scaffold24057_cov20-Tisochrysis_lutea.AAC.3